MAALVVVRVEGTLPWMLDRFPQFAKQLENVAIPLELRYFVVVVIDVLGQAAELTKLEQLAGQAVDSEPCASAIKNSFGRVINVRDFFRKAFDAWHTDLNSGGKCAIGTPDGGASCRVFCDTILGFRQFSDTNIFFSAIKHRDGRVSARTLLGYLVVCGTLFLTFLRHRVPLRGAIELGLGATIGDNDLYGPVLSRAHYLESEIADYPRIVVGSELCRFLDGQVRSSQNTPESHVDRTIAEWCLRLISADSDGQVIVDYLNSSFAKENETNPYWPSMRRDAANFVQIELERFRAERDEKLTPRYERLHSYFRVRGFLD